jgi:hypothetical protein
MSRKDGTIERMDCMLLVVAVVLIDPASLLSETDVLRDLPVETVAVGVVGKDSGEATGLWSEAIAIVMQTSHRDENDPGQARSSITEKNREASSLIEKCRENPTIQNNGSLVNQGFTVTETSCPHRR